MDKICPQVMREAYLWILFSIPNPLTPLFLGPALRFPFGRTCVWPDTRASRGLLSAKGKKPGGSSTFSSCVGTSKFRTDDIAPGRTHGPAERGTTLASQSWRHTMPARISACLDWNIPMAQADATEKKQDSFHPHRRFTNWRYCATKDTITQYYKETFGANH